MNKTITVFEHQSLRLDEDGFDKSHLEALQHFRGEKKDFPYYSLIHKGVKFNEYVGVVQVGNLMIEILPKADQGEDSDRWRRIFIGMLRASGIMDLPAPSSSRLKLKPNALLQLYFERYVCEIERLLHRGLAKKYRKTEGNLHSIKGRIVFSKHISQNVVHQERVYSAFTEFSRQHIIHQVLFKALKLLARINRAPVLQSRIDSLLLDFPEQADVKVSPTLFSRIILSRNTQHYSQAVQIARMILLNFHPDISRGHHDVLAILFDMNVLWERFVYKTLQRRLVSRTPGLHISAQNRMEFWRPEQGRSAHMRPDIYIQCENGTRLILDTKWKRMDTSRPSDQDLRQMYVYHTYFEADRVALVYPGSGDRIRGIYTEPVEAGKECSLFPINIGEQIEEWQERITGLVEDWIKYNE